MYILNGYHISSCWYRVPAYQTTIVNFFANMRSPQKLGFSPKMGGAVQKTFPQSNVMWFIKKECFIVTFLDAVFYKNHIIICTPGCWLNSVEFKLPFAWFPIAFSSSLSLPAPWVWLGIPDDPKQPQKNQQKRKNMYQEEKSTFIVKNRQKIWTWNWKRQTKLTKIAHTKNTQTN